MIVLAIFLVGFLLIAFWYVISVCNIPSTELLQKRIPVRNIPDSYFDGYRRLANTRSDVKEQKCWTCRHAIAYRSWHCELLTSSRSCSYEMCYIKDEISIDDYEAGCGNGESYRNKWLSIPPENK